MKLFFFFSKQGKAVILSINTLLDKCKQNEDLNHLSLNIAPYISQMTLLNRKYGFEKIKKIWDDLDMKDILESLKLSAVNLSDCTNQVLTLLLLFLDWYDMIFEGGNENECSILEEVKEKEEEEEEFEPNKTAYIVLKLFCVDIVNIFHMCAVSFGEVTLVPHQILNYVILRLLEDVLSGEDVVNLITDMRLLVVMEIFLDYSVKGNSSKSIFLKLKHPLLK